MDIQALILSGEYSTDNGLSWFPIANTAGQNSFTYHNLPTTTQFRAEIKNGSCPSLFSNVVTITVLHTVTSANAGTDQKLCGQTTGTLSANTPILGTGTWTALPSNPSLVNFSKYTQPEYFCIWLNNRYISICLDHFKYTLQ
jgi:hypothetical protein